MTQIKILDQTGHTQIEAAPQQAMEIVTQEIASGKWAFVDGVFCPAVTEQSMASAMEVVVTMRLMGG